MSGVNVPQPVLPYSPFAADSSGSSSITSLPFVTIPGLDTTGATDSSAAVQAVVSAYAALGLGTTIWLPAGTLLFTSEVLITGLRIHIRGSGKRATIINFRPTAHDLAAFHFTAGAAVMVQASVQDLTITSDDTTFRKKAVRADDVSEFVLKDISVFPFSDVSNSSIGFEIRGRELTQIIRCSVATSQPVQLKHNPNTAANSGTEDSHAFHISDCQFFPHSSKYSVLLDDGAAPRNFLWTGGFSVGGLGGFFWDNTLVAAVGDVFAMMDVHIEQNTGFAVHFNGGASPTSYRSVSFVRVYGGGGSGGFYVHNATGVTLQSCSYVASGVGLNMTAVYQYVGINNIWLGGSTRTMTGMYEIFGIEFSFDGTAPGMATEFWTATTNSNVAAGNVMRMGGVKQYASTGTVVNGIGNRVNIPFGSGAQIAGIIHVYAHGATKDAGGSVLVTATGASLLSTDPSANFGVGNVFGKITVFFEAPSGISLTNQSGEDMTYGYRIERV